MTELDYARTIVRESLTPTVLELGAHHGNDTTEIYDACRVQPLYVAVEADARNLPYLIPKIGSRRVFIVYGAIAAEDGHIDLHLSDGPGASGSSSIRPPKEHLQHFPDTKFVNIAKGVPAMRLDSLAFAYQVNGAVDLIWCDIQGAERDMIAGGQQTLSRTRYLLCECDRYEMYEGQVTRDGLLELLPGWEVVAEWPENANVLLRNQDVR